MENSLKYRDKNKEACLVWIEVRTVRADRRDTWVDVIYRDNGIGIPTDEVPYVFDHGFRGERPRRINVQGQGIGLAECSQIMKQMDGMIGVHADGNDDGATFAVRIPVFHRLESTAADAPKVS